MKKLTLALAGGTALVAASLGLATPALAAPAGGATQYTGSVAATHYSVPLDCGVHVVYQGSLVDVNWC